MDRLPSRQFWRGQSGLAVRWRGQTQPTARPKSDSSYGEWPRSLLRREIVIRNRNSKRLYEGRVLSWLIFDCQHENCFLIEFAQNHEFFAKSLRLLATHR